jgi:hypothetical protein
MTTELLTLTFYLRCDPKDAPTVGDELKDLVSAGAFSVDLEIDAITISPSRAKDSGWTPDTIHGVNEPAESKP